MKNHNKKRKTCFHCTACACCCYASHSALLAAPLCSLSCFPFHTHLFTNNHTHTRTHTQHMHRYVFPSFLRRNLDKTKWRWSRKTSNNKECELQFEGVFKKLPYRHVQWILAYYISTISYRILHYFTDYCSYWSTAYLDFLSIFSTLLQTLHHHYNFHFGELTKSCLYY